MTRKLVVVGAGPVGCLAAIALAKMGWSVEIYEARPDMRLPSSREAAQQRSINLAISSRGIAAMQAIDPAAASRFLDSVIPMRGRMIHDSNGNLDSQPYDRDGQVGTLFSPFHRRSHPCTAFVSSLNFLVLEKFINSIDRALLNQGLLNEALSVDSIRVLFRHKVVSVNFDGRVIRVFDDSKGEELDRSFDLCIGADGSYFRNVLRCHLSSVAWIFSKSISLTNTLNLKYQPERTIVMIQLFSLIRIIYISGQGILSC
jgi:kynurenine 3-monooxygenase